MRKSAARAVGPVVAAVVVAAALGAGAFLAFDDDDRSTASTAAPTAVVRTSFPGLTAATGEPTAPGLAQAAPSPGDVGQVAGPFDDRFDLQGLAFDGRAVRGTVRVTSDVSDLLDLQVLAGFYDRDGALLGTGRFVHHLEEGHDNQAGPPVEQQAFRIDVPADLRGRAVSAAVTVPVLVNE